MEGTPQGERDFAVDLECGGSISDEVGNANPVLGAKLAKSFVSVVCNGFGGDHEPGRSENGFNLKSNVSNDSKVPQEDVLGFIDKKTAREEKVDAAEKNAGKEKHKKTSAKTKPPKPPRPPRSPSLDAADRKLIKEISELVTMKRARIERMKSLKRMKAARASSSNGNLFAILFTVIFCLVIIFQGMSSRRSSMVSFHGSPELTQGTEGGLISVRYQLNPSASDAGVPGSRSSPNFVESASHSDLGSAMQRAAG